MYSPFQQACARDQWWVVKDMLSEGEDPDEGAWPPICLCAVNNCLRSAHYLLRVCDLSRTTPAGMKASEIAAHEGYLEFLKALVQKGAKLTGDELFIAGRCANWDTAAYLLNEGEGKDAQKAMVRAAFLGDARFVLFLLQEGVPVTARSLNAASARGHGHICKLLLKG